MPSSTVIVGVLAVAVAAALGAPNSVRGSASDVKPKLVRDGFARQGVGQCFAVVSKQCAAAALAISADCNKEIMQAVKTYSPVCCPSIYSYSKCFADASKTSKECSADDRTRLAGDLDKFMAKCPSLSLSSSSPSPTSSATATATTTATATATATATNNATATANATATMTATATSSTTDACFPADAQVELKDGSYKTMAELDIGDEVLSSPGLYSKVFFFGHRIRRGYFSFVSIAATAGDTTTVRLALSGNHYLMVNDKLAAARTVRSGDAIVLSSGAHATVASIDFDIAKLGLFNPHTLSGTIVVNGVQASCYTTTVNPQLAHWLLSVPRAVYSAGLRLPNLLDDLSPAIASFVPSGASAY